MNKLLATYQKDLKWRFKEYQRGKQQGLPMVWGKMMAELKKAHEKEIKKSI